METNNRHNSPVSSSASYTTYTSNQQQQHQRNDRRGGVGSRQPHYSHTKSYQHNIINNSPQYPPRYSSSTTFGAGRHSSIGGATDNGASQINWAWGVGTALLVILTFHYMGNSNRKYGPRSELHAPQHWQDIVPYLLDVIRLILSFLFGIFTRFKVYVTSSPNNNNHTAIGERNSSSRTSRNTQQTLNASKLPELECTLSSSSQTSLVSSSSSGTKNASQQQQQLLEPAFLSEHDYPDGWMVYDAMIRDVVPFFSDRQNLTSSTINTSLSCSIGNGLEEEKKERELDFSNK